MFSKSLITGGDHNSQWQIINKIFVLKKPFFGKRHTTVKNSSMFEFMNTFQFTTTQQSFKHSIWSHGMRWARLYIINECIIYTAASSVLTGSLELEGDILWISMSKSTTHKMRKTSNTVWLHHAANPTWAKIKHNMPCIYASLVLPFQKYLVNSSIAGMHLKQIN